MPAARPIATVLGRPRNLSSSSVVPLVGLSSLPPEPEVGEEEAAEDVGPFDAPAEPEPDPDPDPDPDGGEALDTGSGACPVAAGDEPELSETEADLLTSPVGALPPPLPLPVETAAVGAGLIVPCETVEPSGRML